ncbi:titin homolog [Pectinophora gossypiella]|uniref:titin homolog n=1 Tax=Pectinophora gossypiella TaxID=13191 RepID=UPI00214E819A|nr:titin homolog [Pectinophora gossypiella]
MEEDGGVKAPVTRLRRRLSVETDDTKSPSAPSTPSKKRGGRLAAKPQLELIDEDTITNSPKRTTKSIARDITEPEEKTVTPARRSTRAKSNTSLVSEAEEKVLTPARRSTRIKSNTSIVSEAAQTVDSPRAKRAVARRNSQLGSDTEASVTPARTRRTRKGSTSSIDKEGTPSISETAVTPGQTRRTRKGSTSNENPVEASQEEKPSSLITEIIAEEPESTLRKSTSETNNVENGDASSSTRKSPRLMAMKHRRSKSEDSNDIKSQSVNEQDKTPIAKKESNLDTNATETDSQNDILSVSSANLLKELDSKPKKKTSDKNKSASDIEIDSKSKRHRTKSWGSLSATPPNEGQFFSDNESIKKKLKKHGKIFNDKRLSGSGDSKQKSITGDKSLVDDEDTEIIFNTSKKNRRSKDISFNAHKSVTLNESTHEIPSAADTSNESNKENLLGGTPVIKESTTELFDKAPSAEIKTIVFIEDTDSNTGSLGKQNDDKDDQCVPVVQHPAENQIISSEMSNNIPSVSIFTAEKVGEKLTINQSCEPMDIDETIPDNVSMSAFTIEDKLEKSRRKSSLCISSEADSSTKESKNKSKRKSLLSNSSIQDKESFENVNKSFESNVKNSSKDEINSAVYSRKSSLSTHDEVDSSFKESANKYKRKSSKSDLVEVENVNNSTLSQSQAKNSPKEDAQNRKTRKSSLNITSDTESITTKGSKRKSSMSYFTSEDHEKTENKTTLVLSQIKDISATDNNVSKSPQIDSNELSRAKDGIVNKNLSINYMTSTPVQKKNMEKLGMQMNTSVITPNNDRKTKITPKKDVSITSNKSGNCSSEQDSEISEEESEEKNNLLDDEAEEASENYESGDSQNEEERQYERENEIVERGETLTSEDEISNDSDYEKGSFIVSSDEEDDELLSGLGDDLNMSDNELTMTEKSKKKYNERKMKEQKKASREMYEARHKINDSSDKNSKVVKAKKNNRNRLDSSLLESGDEISMPPKKNKRMRLESTLETSQTKPDTEEKKTKNNDSDMSDAEEIGRKKKKSKRLSESVCDESAINEKEITINNEEMIEKDDPLSIKIKTEPKTPLKYLEISTVHFTDREDIEQVQVSENMSMMTENETSDPLRETVAEDQNGDISDDSISENEEITNKYDSVLKELNKENKSRQIKSHDISLNLHKKNKQKPKEAIVEELNLTQTKKSKKKVQDTPEQSKEKTVKRVFKKLADNNDELSDFDDLKLLFSDESNDSSEKKHESIKTVDGTDSFIPLKRTPGKTNILKPTDTSANDSLLNSRSKKKNKKSNKTDENEDTNTNEDGEELKFFIDTKGDLLDTESSTMESLNTSSKMNSGSDVKSADNGGADSDDAPVETSYLSEKSKKRNKKTSISVDASMTENGENSTLTRTSKSDKKKRLSESQETEIPEHEISAPKTPASEKKKKKLSMSCENQTTSPIPVATPPSVTSEKKKKRLSESDGTGPLETAVAKTPCSDKKKNKLFKSNDNQIGNSETTITDPKTPQSAKKKKKLSESHEDTTIDIPELKNVVETPTSNKKKKKVSEFVEFGVENVMGSTEVVEDPVAISSKKRKRKSSANQTQEEIGVEDDKVLNISGNESIGNKKKKQKISVTKDDIAPIQVTETKLSKKRKKRDDDVGGKKSKVLKEHSPDKVHVPRLPRSVINRLDDKPKAEVLEMKKAKLVSTADFVVEETRRRRNKPSNFLEESVYLNDDDNAPVTKKKAIMKKPKVLPFLPTVSTSDNGFTTNFQVNVISRTMEFVAKKNEMPHFKEDYLNNRKIKKLRTYDLYKKHRNVKLSKF